MKVSEKTKRRKYFKERVFFWQKSLGFMDVQIYVGSGAQKRSRAEWFSSREFQQISILYNTEWLYGTDISLENIDRTAFHEVYESQFYEVCWMVEVMFNNETSLEKIHRIVRRAELCIYPALKDLIGENDG